MTNDSGFMNDRIEDAKRRYAAARKAYSNYAESDADSRSSDSQEATQHTHVSNDEHVETPDAPAHQNDTPANNPEAATDTDTDEASEPAGEETPGDPTPEERIVELETELEEVNDRLLRQAAEFQNFRRRMQREKKKFHRSGKKEVILPMLDVLDDFQRSIEAAEQLQEQDDLEAAYESLRSGVEMVFDKFMAELQGIGVETIEAEGEPFNEELHEAMMQQPAPDDVAEGTVLQEIRRGYRLDDQVLRHSRVIVAS
jgi:molecular chaperone GrpE